MDRHLNLPLIRTRFRFLKINSILATKPPRNADAVRRPIPKVTAMGHTRSLTRRSADAARPRIPKAIATVRTLSEPAEKLA